MRHALEWEIGEAWCLRAKVFGWVDFVQASWTGPIMVEVTCKKSRPVPSPVLLASAPPSASFSPPPFFYSTTQCIQPYPLQRSAAHPSVAQQHRATRICSLSNENSQLDSGNNFPNPFGVSFILPPWLLPSRSWPFSRPTNPPTQARSQSPSLTIVLLLHSHSSCCFIIDRQPIFNSCIR